MESNRSSGTRAAQCKAVACRELSTEIDRRKTRTRTVTVIASVNE